MISLSHSFTQTLILVGLQTLPYNYFPKIDIIRPLFWFIGLNLPRSLVCKFWRGWGRARKIWSGMNHVELESWCICCVKQREWNLQGCQIVIYFGWQMPGELNSPQIIRRLAALLSRVLSRSRQEIVIFSRKKFGICLPTKYSQIIGRYLPKWIDLDSYKLLNRVQLNGLMEVRGLKSMYSQLDICLLRPVEIRKKVENKSDKRPTVRIVCRNKSGEKLQERVVVSVWKVFCCFCRCCYCLCRRCHHCGCHFDCQHSILHVRTCMKKIDFFLCPRLRYKILQNSSSCAQPPSPLPENQFDSLE